MANLPITLYPGMKIGRIGFLRMTTAAEVPYGSKAVGSKYRANAAPPPVGISRTSCSVGNPNRAPLRYTGGRRDRVVTASPSTHPPGSGAGPPGQNC